MATTLSTCFKTCLQKSKLSDREKRLLAKSARVHAERLGRQFDVGDYSNVFASIDDLKGVFNDLGGFLDSTESMLHRFMDEPGKRRELSGLLREQLRDLGEYMAIGEQLAKLDDATQFIYDGIAAKSAAQEKRNRERATKTHAPSAVEGATVGGKTVERPEPNRADPLYEQKNALRQLQNSLDSGVDPQGAPWDGNPKLRASYEKRIKQLEDEITSSHSGPEKMKARKATESEQTIPAQRAEATDKLIPERPKDTRSRAAAGGETGVNGYFYAGGQFLPSTDAPPGTWSIGGKVVKSGREEIEPGKWEMQPTPFSRSILRIMGSGVWVTINKDGVASVAKGVFDNDGEPITPQTTIRSGVNGGPGKEVLTLQELVDAYNKGQRWFDVNPNADKSAVRKGGDGMTSPIHETPAEAADQSNVNVGEQTKEKDKPTATPDKAQSDGSKGFKKGDRVVIGDVHDARLKGRHGVVVDTNAHTIIMSAIGLGSSAFNTREDRRVDVTVKTDQGYEAVVDSVMLTPETGEAPAVDVPDIDLSGRHYLPSTVWNIITHREKLAYENAQAGFRAKKSGKKEEFADAADKNRAEANAARKAFNAWAEKYPDAAMLASDGHWTPSSKARVEQPSTPIDEKMAHRLANFSGPIEVAGKADQIRRFGVGLKARTGITEFNSMRNEASRYGGQWDTHGRSFMFKDRENAIAFMRGDGPVFKPETLEDGVVRPDPESNYVYRLNADGLWSVQSRGRGDKDNGNWRHVTPSVKFEAKLSDALKAKTSPASAQNVQTDAETPKQEPQNVDTQRAGTTKYSAASTTSQQPAGISGTGGGGQTGGVRGGTGAGNTGGVRGRGDASPDGNRQIKPAALGENPAGGIGTTASVGAADAVAASTTRSGDYRIGSGELTREGSWLDTARRNVEIVELVNRITKEGRAATPDEQAKLVKFTGWGAGEIRNNLFPKNAGVGNNYRPHYLKGEWEKLGERVAEVFTPEDWRTAMKSTQYAHYTSEPVIRAIWRGVERLGFSGGSVLEPGAGVGLFAGLMPDSIQQNSKYVGVEMDGFSAKIAQLLLPAQAINPNGQGDFIKAKLPRSFFDVAIGNPPFQAGSKIPYNGMKLALHDFFFAKTIDQVRPGGLVVFVTSRYTMDKKDAVARQYLSERADLLGAVRLPQTAFKGNAGTEVVTDVLFLRKRESGQASGGMAWNGLAEVETNKGGKAEVNEYFADHPEMVLGQHSEQGSMYRANEYTVLPKAGDIEAHFAAAVENLPANVYSVQSQNADTATIRKAAVEKDWNPKHRKEGGVYLSDTGDLMRVEGGVGTPLGSAMKLSNRDAEWLKAYVPLRDALKQAHYDQLTDGDWKSSLKALQKQYDGFVKQFGPVLAFTKTERTEVDEDGEETTVTVERYTNAKLMRADVEGSLLYSLETIKEDGTIVKAPVLLDRVLKKPTQPKIENAHDALAVALAESGVFDLGQVAALAGLSPEQTIKALGDTVYRQPGGGWVLNDEYLSGDVKSKLEEAQTAAKLNPAFQRNVDALLNVQPSPLGASDITVGLGATWVPLPVSQHFALEVMQIPEASIGFNPVTNEYSVESSVGPQLSRSATHTWGTAWRSPQEILDAALNHRTFRIYSGSGTKEDPRVFEEKATAEANEMVANLNNEFASWVWTDSARAEKLISLYNEKFNRLAPRFFDGSHIAPPGLSLKFNLHPHQKRAIWRAIQTGNTYFAHAVGSGKTLEMIIAGMEQKRLGLINKPMYVVPNHMLAQFAREFLEAYPAANIMVADEHNFHADNRRRFIAQSALNNPDAIVITHSAFKIMEMKPENIRNAFDDVLNDLRESLEEIPDEWENKKTRSQIEAQIERIERGLESKESKKKDKRKGNDETERETAKNSAVYFEDLGVDYLFVDEAHEYRKLDYATKMQVKGLSPIGSIGALRMFVKTRWLEKQRPGRSFTFASGTPITNTMAELFTIQRFFQEKELRSLGLIHFDAWAAQFGRVKAEYERNATGGWETVNRFSKFVNVADMMAMVRQFMDVLTMNELSGLVKLPTSAEGNAGRRNIVTTPQPQALTDYMQGKLSSRLEKSREWKPTKAQPHNPDPVTNIITDGRLSSIDMRFIDPKLPSDPDSKLNRLIDRIAEDYKLLSDNEYIDQETGNVDPIKGGAQIVFASVGLGEGVAASRGFSAKDWIKRRLKEAGVPAAHVAFMDEHTKAADKEKLFKDMRQGKVRILIGTPKNMGTGVNVQKRLARLYHLDAPWYPSDIEQPEGRILRQGNQNPNISITGFATEGTYDSTMWGMVSRKAGFIEQAFAGDRSLRVMEDMSESGAYSMAAAIASGDQRYVQLAQLESELARLNTQAATHDKQQRALYLEIDKADRAISEYSSQLDKASDIARVLSGKSFYSGSYDAYVNSVAESVGNRKFPKAKAGELGDAVLKAYRGVIDAALQEVQAKAANSAWLNAKQSGGKEFVVNKSVEIGGLDDGIKIIANARAKAYLMSSNVSVDEIRGNVDHSDIELSVNGNPLLLGVSTRNQDDISGDSVGRAINMALTEASGMPARIKRKISETQEQLVGLRRRYGTPFAHAREQAEKTAEIESLRRELANEGKDVSDQGESTPTESALPASAGGGTASLRPAPGGVDSDEGGIEDAYGFVQEGREYGERGGFQEDAGGGEPGQGRGDAARTVGQDGLEARHSINQARRGGSTPEAIRAEFAAAGLGDVTEKMEKDGLLKIVPFADAPPIAPRTAHAMYMPSKKGPGTISLYYDNMQPGRAPGVFLHEGTHQTLRGMMGDDIFARMQSDFNAMLADGDAIAAKVDQHVASLVKRETRKINESDMTPEDKAKELAILGRIADEERIAYSVEYATNREAVKSMSERFRRWLSKVMGAIRAWVYRQPRYQAMAAKGYRIKMTPDALAALAREAVSRQAFNQGGDDGQSFFSHKPEERPAAYTPAEDDGGELYWLAGRGRTIKEDVEWLRANGRFDEANKLVMAYKTKPMSIPFDEYSEDFPPGIFNRLWFHGGSWDGKEKPKSGMWFSSNLEGAGINFDSGRNENIKAAYIRPAKVLVMDDNFVHVGDDVIQDAKDIGADVLYGFNDANGPSVYIINGDVVYPEPNNNADTNAATDQDYMAAVDRGDMATAKRMVDDKIAQMVDNGGMVIMPSDEDAVAFKYHRGPAPKKTLKAYAVFNVSNGMRAAYAGTQNIIPAGMWLDAQAIQSYPSKSRKFQDGTPVRYIPGDTGASSKEVDIDPTEYGLPKGQKWLFYRPGKHAGSLPNFAQMNVKDDETGAAKAAMPHDKIIFEIEVGADADMTQTMLDEAPRNESTGNIDYKRSGLKRLPRDGGKEGFYYYQTNPNAKGKWIIASSFKINRLVPFSEIEEVNRKAGEQVPKWNGGYKPEDYGITEQAILDAATENRKLSDPVTYDDNGNVIPLSQRFNRNSPDVRYSRGPMINPSGMPLAQARKAVDAIMAKWPGASPIDVRVFATQDDAGMGGDNGIVEAALFPPENGGVRQLRIVAENVRDEAHLLEIMREEIIGHVGLRGLLGQDEHAKLMRAVEKAAQEGGAWRDRWVDVSGRDPKTGGEINVNAPYFAADTPESRAMWADETISKMARDGVKDGLLRRFAAFLARTLRRIGLLKTPMTDVEAMALLAESARRLGDRQARNGAESAKDMASPDALYSRINRTPDKYVDSINDTIKLPRNARKITEEERIINERIMEHINELREKENLDRIDRVRGVDIRGETERLLIKLHFNETTKDELMKDIEGLLSKLNIRKSDQISKQIKDDEDGLERGYDWAVERLTRAKRKGEVSAEAADLGLWLLSKNKSLADDIAWSFKKAKESTSSGAYFPSESLIMIAKLSKYSNVDDSLTVAHEILHHSEQFIPSDMRSAILKEYANRLSSFVYHNHQLYPEQTDAVLKAVGGDIDDFVRLVKANKIPRSAYQFVNASEFWAENASRILRETMLSKSSVIRRLKHWLIQFIEKLKKFAGFDSDNPVYVALMSIINGNTVGGKGMLLSQFADEYSDMAYIKYRPKGDVDFLSSLRNDYTKAAATAINDHIKTSKTFNRWWHKTVGSQTHKAKIDPEHFGPVYNASIDYELYAAKTANESADLAPSLLPKAEGLGAAFGELADVPRLVKTGDKTNIGRAWRRIKNARAIGRAIFQTTMNDRLLSDQELEKLGYTDTQRQMYREFFAAVNHSMDELAKAEMYRSGRAARIEFPDGTKMRLAPADESWDVDRTAKWYYNQVTAPINRQIAEITRINQEKQAELAKLRKAGGKLPGIRRYVTEEAAERAKMLRADYNAKIKALLDEIKGKKEERKAFIDKARRIKQLQANGYAPLMRFGRYTVTVKYPSLTGENESVVRALHSLGKPPFFMFEREADARQMARSLAEIYPGAEITAGVMAQKDFELFSGITPETVEVLARAMGIDQDKAFQVFLQQAVSNRSALKRLIERKKIPGFAQDPQRVLAAFITSNARAASKARHIGAMIDAIAAIPKEKGDVKDEAIDLYKFVQNPQEPSVAIRSALFALYLGGSVMAAAVNLTQTLTTTYPWLAQHADQKKLVSEVLPKAMKTALLKNDDVSDPVIRAALHRADEEGVTAPHQLYMLYSEASRLGALSSSVFRPLGNAWGAMFSAAEAYNRRVAFIAAYQTALDNHEKDPFKFAKDAVNDTQFVYNKSARSNWGRSPVGAALLTFKTFTVGYLEFLKRLPPNQRMLALGVLALLSGAGGLPGADDADDLLETLAQASSKDLNMKEWKRAKVEAMLRALALNEAAARRGAGFAMHGISEFASADVSQRLGVGNLIPGSGVLKKSNPDKSRDVAEFFGPTGSLFTRGAEAFDAMSSRGTLPGKAYAMSKAVLPKAFADAMQAFDMWQTGHYRDYKGRNVTEANNLDVFFKAIGAQPSRVARQREKDRAVAQSIGLATARREDISALWAAGFAENDDGKKREAKDMLRQWNEDNPDTPLHIDMAAVQKRARAMRQDSAERLLKQAPRSMKKHVREALDLAN